MNYTLVFDATNASIAPMLIPLSLAIAAALFGYFGPRISPKAYSQRHIFRLVSAVLFLVGLLSFFAAVSFYMREREAISGERLSRVEGVVCEFVAPHGHHRGESFSVGGVRFEYGENDVMTGFHTTSSSGGPIHQGLPVKVWYLRDVGGRNEILRLEAAASAPAGACAEKANGPRSGEFDAGTR